MRADVYLTEHGFTSSRQRAKTLIGEGNVTVDGKVLCKPSEEIDGGREHDVTVRDTQKYVSRGGDKLEAALTEFGIDVRGCVALDVGASTGGFTDCLLSFGAERVIAVDAGVGQLAKKLCDDPRVTSIEHFNARELNLSAIGGQQVDRIVMDVSFISATYIIPRFAALLSDGGVAICLIKPQFEVGQRMLGKGGIVKDPTAHRFAIERVLTSAEENGLIPTHLTASPIKGGDGNREFLVCLRKQTGEESSQINIATIRRVVGG